MVSYQKRKDYYFQQVSKFLTYNVMDYCTVIMCKISLESMSLNTILFFVLNFRPYELLMADYRAVI